MKAVAFIGLAALALAANGAGYTDLKRDEQICFYPAVAHRSAAGAWEIDIRGCVYEPEKRALALTALREALDLKDVEMSPVEERIFKERVRLFLVDHERRKRIVVRLAGKKFDLGKTAADGQFAAVVRISQSEFGLGAGKLDGRCLELTAVLPPKDQRHFTGEVFLLEDEGVSVISDIDDTIKVTEVRDRRATLRNTFLREFQPVPGMAEFYQALARSNRAAFHYVSASPWQLCPPLSGFVRTHGFPPGSFHLKTFRWKDRSFLSLFADPEKYKSAVIEPLLKRFPNRRFILIGDSGERDPEIYAALARNHPRQIAAICIRDVTGESGSVERYAKTFRGLPKELWQVFKSPDEIKSFVDRAPALP